MRSTLEEGLYFAQYDTTYNVENVLDEVQSCLFHREFWFDHTRGHINTSKTSRDRLLAMMFVYEQKLKLSILALEVLGLSFEPPHDYRVWDEFPFF